MTDEEEIQKALIAIHSRLGTIEGKMTLVARADKPRYLAAIKEIVKKDPLSGQIYLLLDGKRSQREILNELKKFKIQTSEMTVSRRMSDLATEHGLADLVSGGRMRVYRQNREMEKTLNLAKNVAKWLTENQQIVPARPKRKRKSK